MSRPLFQGLTESHQKIIHALARFERRREIAFISDLVQELKLAGESSLVPTLRIMERNGFVEMRGGGVRGRSRVVSLTGKGRHTADLGILPLLGMIPAGPLKEAIAEEGNFVETNELLSFRPGDFLLEVNGDSMVGDGILDGDKVLLRPDIKVEHGEIAAVMVGEDHEATLKRVFFQPKKREVALRASNPKYPDRVVKADDLKIAGVFRGLIRSV